MCCVPAKKGFRYVGVLTVHGTQRTHYCSGEEDLFGKFLSFLIDLPCALRA